MRGINGLGREKLLYGACQIVEPEPRSSVYFAVMTLAPESGIRFCSILHPSRRLLITEDLISTLCAVAENSLTLKQPAFLFSS